MGAGDAAFTVGISHDFVAPGSPTTWGDIGLAELTGAGTTWRFLPEDAGELVPETIDGYDAVLFGTPSITRRTVSGSRPPLVLARFGVGLDAVDLDACTEAGVAVTITPDGARRAVATAALTLILAASHNLLAKDRLVRNGDWTSRSSLMGRGLSGRRVGAFGLGNVALELFHLLTPFGTTNLATDPHRSPEEAAAHGVRLVDLPELMSGCDIIVVTAALTTDTHRAIDADMLALVRPGAILINVARGAIIDTAALVGALTNGQLAAAGLDVVDPEPLPHGHPLLELANVVLAPHALAWTDEMARGNGASAIKAILDIRAGRVPEHLANPAVLEHSRLRDRLAVISR